MYSYTLAMEIDNQVFRCACRKIENAFPSAKKEELLIDVDGSMIQNYYIEGRKIRVVDDVCFQFIGHFLFLCFSDAFFINFYVILEYS